MLKFDQFYCDYEESLINRSLFEWNPLHTLKTLSIGKETFLKVQKQMASPAIESYIFQKAVLLSHCVDFESK